ncbi:MAG: RNA polymerase sigma factor [Bacteroidetes bacterium]|nr:RNA polymerase sigma factor [Bacteroidota bacterium]
MDLTDKATAGRLVESCVRGNSKSQQVLYKTFYGKMLAVCMRYAHDYEEARDILHDGFIKVFAKLESFQNLGSLEGWVRRIIVNNAIDHLRKKKEFVVSHDESGLENVKDESDDEKAINEDIRMKADLIIRLIQKLTPAYRAAFNLYVIENYSHKEIAEMLGISIGASKSNLAKAKMKLREMFNKHINGIK